MLVRDLALKKTEYKGRPTWAIDAQCPCRPCWNAHDCGHINSQSEWVSIMHCATNWNKGCPPDEERQPEHEYRPTGRVCIHCGAPKPKPEPGVKRPRFQYGKCYKVVEGSGGDSGRIGIAIHPDPQLTSERFLKHIDPGRYKPWDRKREVILTDIKTYTFFVMLKERLVLIDCPF